ncbi:MAG TPA: metallophosphoesterase [Ktedonobacteraceae bacterium]|nr:metallophosphoesterase [Ktedonobacteraceae bacterium]
MQNTPQSIQWLHLSDIHMGKDELGQEQMSKGLIKYFDKEQLRPDIIFITGDIANKGKETEYQQFSQVFFSRLLDKMKSIHGSEGGKRIFVIPGNHDVDREEAEMAWMGVRLDIEKQGPKALALEPSSQGLKKRREIVARFENYAHASYLHESVATGGNWISSQEGAYKCVLDFSGYRVGILGLNTAWVAGASSSGHDSDKEHLSPGQFIVRKGLEYLRETEKCDIIFVLGHHSIDWFHNIQGESDSIRALFGAYHVIYLNGDLHESRVKTAHGAEREYLVMQTGAVYQERQHELWINRLLRCELDVAAHEIHIYPLQWSRNDEGWVRDNLPGANERLKGGIYYNFQIPGSPKRPAQTAVPAVASLEPPVSPVQWEGWMRLTKEYLDTIRAKETLALDEDQLVHFFDGLNPTWKYALSPKIPRRAREKELCALLDEIRRKDQTHIVVLSGGGGEGKSTILQQVVCDLLESETGWNILWHQKRHTPLSEKLVRELPSGVGTWLIVSDDAEKIVKDVYDSIQALREPERTDIHFLLCCRDTDWNMAKGDSYTWQSDGAKCLKFPIGSLTLPDAKEIVERWSDCGKRGMGDLYGSSIDAAAHKLHAFARDEAAEKKTGGSFLGAMIRTRFSESMQDHVLALLNSLNRENSIKTFDGRPLTLLHAYAHIAALHAVNFLGLTDKILASSMQCSVDDLHEYIIGPLGLEAVVTSDLPGEIEAQPFLTEEAILTRHRAIAEEAVKLLDRFHIKLENTVGNLLEAATKLLPKRDWSPWRSLPSRFAEKKMYTAAIKLGKIWVEKEKNNVQHVRYLANFYVKNDDAPKAVRVYQDAFNVLSFALKDKLYYHEWGYVEGEAKNLFVAVWLTAFALADGGPPDPERNNKYTPEDRAIIFLNGLSLIFGKISKATNEPIFNDAWIAATTLGVDIQGSHETRGTHNKLLQSKEEIEKDRPRLGDRAPYTHREAFSVLEKAVSKAWDRLEHPLPIPKGSNLKFTRAAMLVMFPGN